MPDIKMTFYGVRGSYPVPGIQTKKYGGNTASILIEIGDEVIILDAGTGIIAAGKYLVEQRPQVKTIHIFLSHFHTDHIMGLTFFSPVFRPGYTLRIYAPVFKDINPRDTIHSLFLPPFSPITLNGIRAVLDFRNLAIESKQKIGISQDIFMEYRRHNSSPLLEILVYKLNHESRSLVYATDIESPDGFDPELTSFVSQADVLIHDAQYSDEEYGNPENSKKGYGHSTISMAVNNAQRCGVKRLFLFHHNPENADRVLETISRAAREKFANTSLARESGKILF